MSILSAIRRFDPPLVSQNARYQPIGPENLKPALKLPSTRVLPPKPSQPTQPNSPEPETKRSVVFSPRVNQRAYTNGTGSLHDTVVGMAFDLEGISSRQHVLTVMFMAAVEPIGKKSSR